MSSQEEEYGPEGKKATGWPRPIGEWGQVENSRDSGMEELLYWEIQWVSSFSR